MTRKETRLLGVGRSPEVNHGVVNPPVYHASTIVYPTLSALEEADRTPYEGTRYGRRGTPTTFALEEAVAELEGGFRSIAVPSGLCAITTALLAFLRTGDHLLMVDSVYAPTRHFCDTVLAGVGIETSYYDPLADVAPPVGAPSYSTSDPLSSAYSSSAVSSSTSSSSPSFRSHVADGSPAASSSPSTSPSFHLGSDRST